MKMRGRAAARKVGFVFQSFQLLGNLTALESASGGGRHAGSASVSGCLDCRARPVMQLMFNREHFTLVLSRMPVASVANASAASMIEAGRIAAID